MTHPGFEPSPKLVALVEAMKQHTQNQEAGRRGHRYGSGPTANPITSQIALRHIANAFSPWVSQASRNAFQKVEFTVDVAPNLTIPNALVLPIQTILTHLLQNALYHGIEPSRERSGQGKSPVSQLKLSAKVEDEDLVITLCDDGRGLPELFTAMTPSRGHATPQSFASRAGETSIFALPSGGTGLGVGLHIVKSLTQKLSGDVSFWSLPQQGTTVVVRFPCAHAAQSL